MATTVSLLGEATHAQQPLAAIDWLTPEPQSTTLPETILLEPPVTKTARRPEITVKPLKSLPQPIGLVSAAATGLPMDLWSGSSPEDLTRLLATVRVTDSPAMQSLLFTLLLSEARAPEEDDDQLLLARLDRLMDLGATDPAQALAEQAGPTQSPARFQRWFDASLLTGDEDRACAALLRMPHLAPSYAERIFCDARLGDWTTAALLLESAHTLNLLPEAELNLLDRFLNPDVFEFAPPPSAPDTVRPLTFRLFESIGEPLPTTNLPRAFAAADLRDIAGWKAQLEAAERLVHIGALHPNQLLGLFSERKPAASGGVWDRVSALQRFETALKSGSSEAVAKTLPTAWVAVKQSGIETGFAELFADALTQFNLTGSAAELAWRVRLLAPEYELAALLPPSGGANNDFLTAVAMGKDVAAEAQPALTPVQGAISRAFAADAPQTEVPTHLRQKIESGRLGEAILQAMVLFDQGSDGNWSALSSALATFRLVGLEDTARRAALQLAILER
ncbi:hypothetical protein GFB49_02320 [Epibacterium sp. SM1979]|uniref:Uncharacterized protein n=2 Tax=Tritonibacter litoralis TaxID=2662264 RepID=A0A843YD78_9RHOB|nr:hypothetical protein [Tritonibacter litoralis]MQQ07282.1 hypothetical protein [Tritonibacter litoralis]